MTRAPEAVLPQSPLWPPPHGGLVVVLSRARTSLERGLIEAWARTLEGSTVLVAAEPTEAVRLAAREDALVVPVRVTWTATGDPVVQRALLRGPWRAVAQAGVRARRPESCRLLVGEPATRGELTARWNERGASPDGFAGFVGRQADIALERSRRRVWGDQFRAPRAVVEEVLTSKGFTAKADNLARTLDRNPDGVLTDARAYLEEMASEERQTAIDLWARLARYLHSRAYVLKVDQDQVRELRALSAIHPMVFLPSHRSNLDPYVMTSVTHDNGLPVNHVLGGINMAFWPLGPLARRVGMVFIRRSFRDNEVYRFVLAQYLGFLVAKRFNIEFYMEGGRSRTGKLLPPKLGLFHYLADAVEERELKDVLVVPTAIVYDLLHEAGEMTSESRGAVKRAEGLRWMLRFARTQSRDMGAAHVRFGEPLNLYDALKAQAEDTPDRRLARSKVAFEVFTRINRATVVTAPALVSFALLGIGDRALTLTQVREVLDPVLAYVTARATPTDSATRALSTAAGVEGTLATLVAHGVVASFDGGPETVYGIGPEQELVAAFYRNGTLHWFVNRAIVELALLRAAAVGSEQDVVEVAWDEAFRLRDLLKFEFFFADKEEFRQELFAELALIEPEWKDRRGEVHEIGPALQAAGALVANRVLRSFVEAYSVVADQLVSLGNTAAKEESVVTASLGLGQQYLRQRRVTSAEAVSSHLFRTCLKLAANRGLLEARPGVQSDRAAFAAEVHDVLARLEEITRVDQAPLAAAPEGALT